MQVWQAGQQIGATASGDTPPTEPTQQQNVSPAFQRATFHRMQSRIHGRPSAHGCRIDSKTDSNTRRSVAENARNGAKWGLRVCCLCISERLWSSMDKGVNHFSGASRFSAWRGFYGSQRIRESRRPSRQWFGGRLLARIYATP